MLHARKQQGAALMLMLVILVLGAATVLVSSLNSSRLKIERDKITADALAQAKEALIGRAVADDESPGSLACPDTDDNGSAESPVGQPNGNCPSYIGRLPWRSLNLPDLRDSSGERLWYVLSQNFRDYVNLNPINSNSLGTLNVSGPTPASNTVALVFAAGPALSNQSRSSTIQSTCSTTTTTIPESWCATNYLEGGNPALNLQASPNLNYQSATTSSTFNDNLIIIRKRDIIPRIELRVTKELTKAFENYLAANGNYPYPANFATTCTTTSCPSDNSQCRGKIPATQMNLYTSLPWFTDNKWFNVIYYTAGTASLLGGGGGGGGGGGKTAKGKKPGGSSGSGGGGSSGITTCPSGNNGKLNVLDTSGTTFTNNASALFFLPGIPFDGVTRASTGISATNLSTYLEDAENINLDDTYAFPGVDSNDLLFILP